MDIQTQLSLIADGVDPMTGEVFDTAVFFEDSKAQNAIIKLSSHIMHNGHISKRESQNLLNRPVEEISQKLREMRLDFAAQIGLPAYCVFEDSTLYNIAAGDVQVKTDLLCIKGIGPKRYELYGDAIFDILSEYI